MAVLALALWAAWFLLAFGLRTWIQVRRTGDTGWRAHRLPGGAGSREWWAGLLFVLALLVGLAAPVAELVGLPRIGGADHPVVQTTGTVFASVGVLLTLLAQLSMGDAWRIGVDEAERTELVTSGAFAIVRNPIFGAMLITAVGLALMVPNGIAVVGFATLTLSIELQVRGVEEPYLMRIHGAHYAGYAHRVGRFVPALGRMRRPTGVASNR